MPAFSQLTDGQVNSLVTVLNELWKNHRAAGPVIAVPPRPEPTAAALAVGEAVFRTSCATCHGELGRGDGLLAASLPTRPATLAPGELKAGETAEQIYLRVAAGVPPLMPAFRATLSPDSIWAVVSHIEVASCGGVEDRLPRTGATVTTRAKAISVSPTRGLHGVLRHVDDVRGADRLLHGPPAGPFKELNRVADWDRCSDRSAASAGCSAIVMGRPIFAGVMLIAAVSPW
jgi:mono/diheme cytochrome c family protein